VLSAGILHPIWGQLLGVGIAIGLAGAGTAAIMLLLKYTMGVRVSAEDEQEGLDITQHGEEAYNDRE
jgi:ammonium transporter, Amt family